MSAYLILDTKITDSAAYEAYKLKAKPIAEKFGGVYRVRGSEIDLLENELWEPTRVVVIEFPSKDQARSFYNSEEYKPVRAIRQNNAACTVFLVDGD
ncbi:MAG: DUF1330 domain-containing protein [Oceanicoccus sp.]